MDFSNYKFRCSSLGHIMVDPKGKSNQQIYDEAVQKAADKKAEYNLLLIADKTGTKLSQKVLADWEAAKGKVKEYELKKDKIHLSDSCKTHLCDLYTALKYNRTEDIKSKYLEKGLHSEEDGITLWSLVTGLMHTKNTERKENDWLTGEMDFPSDDDYINDIKSNWTIFQFNRVRAKPLKPLYKWQAKGYMWLWNKQKARIIYALINTPEHLIKIEESRLKYDFVGTQEDWEEAVAEIRRLHTYDDIPNKDRVIPIEVLRDEADEELIKNRVEECRRFLNSLNNQEADGSDEE